MKKKSSFPFFQFLLAAFPVVSLLGHNIQEVSLRAGLRPLFYILLVTVCAWAALSFATKSFQKASFITLWVLLLFFTYGRVYSAFSTTNSFGQILGHHRFLLPLWFVLGAGGVYVILKFAKEAIRANIIKYANDLSSEYCLPETGISLQTQNLMQSLVSRYLASNQFNSSQFAKGEVSKKELQQFIKSLK